MNSKDAGNIYGWHMLMVSNQSVQSAKVTIVKSVIAGAFTGAIDIFITYPAEFTKTLLQLESSGSKRKCTGMIDCMVKTVRSHGILGLYRGVRVLLYGCIPLTAIRFGTFETIRSFLADENGQLTNSNKFTCGVGAGIIEALLIVTPVETIKVKLIQDERNVKSSSVKYVQNMIRREGFRTVYKGLTATILKQSTNQSIRFFFMEYVKEIYREENREWAVPKWAIGLYCGIGGAISVVCNNPIDVVKTRMQGNRSGDYKNIIDCTKKVYAQEGFRGFLKGLIPRLGRTTINVAMVFVIYDSVLSIINGIWYD